MNKWILVLPLLAAGSLPATELDRAFERLYNFDFRGAHTILDRAIEKDPAAPLPYAVRSSAYLFYELDRLGILESEFFADDKKIIEKKKLKPDPEIRARLFDAIAEAERRAQAVLAKSPEDRDALFAMCVTLGITTDYTALVEKKQFASLSIARKAHGFALRLLKLDPKFHDARLTTGVNDYLLGSLPFFVRWFVKFDEAEGSKDAGISSLKLVAEEGRYLKGFAKILLAVVYLREKKPRETERLLTELAREYPGNELIRKELAKVATQLGGGRD